MLRWPDRDQVAEAVRRWAAAIGSRPEVRSVGYIGSYARGDWGVGSDVDLVVLVEPTSEPLHRRAIRYDTTTLPVPADLIVATESEWAARAAADRAEVVWVYPATRPPGA